MIKMDNYQNYLGEIQALLNCRDINDYYERVRQLVVDFQNGEDDSFSSDKIEADFAQILENTIKSSLREMDSQPPVRRNLSITRLLMQVMKFIPDRKRAEETIATLNVSHCEPELHTLRSLSNLLEKRQSTYYVDGLFRSGLFLIAGYAKTGKSLWLFNLSVCLVLGIPFLNRRSTQCNVLIIQNEEPLTGTGERLLNSCLQDFYLENPELYNELLDSHRLVVVKGYDIGVDSEKIFKIVDDHNIGAVFVDSFRASISKSGITELDMASVGVMYKFQAEIHKRDMLGVVVHHTNKASNMDNPLKMIGGNGGLVGANDGNGILVINKDKTFEGSTTVDFLLIPRNDNPCKINYVYDEQEACRWDFKVLEDQSLSEDYLKTMREIIMVLQELYEEWLIEDPEKEKPPKGLTTNRLANTLDRDKKELIKCLNDLDKCDGIIRYRKGKEWVYCIPEGGSPMYYLVEEVQKRNELEEKQNELDKQFLIQILKCNTLKELETLYADLDEDDKTRIRDKRTIEHESHIFKLRHPQKFEIGDRVYCVFGFTTDEQIKAFGVKRIVDVQLRPPAKNSNDKFNEDSWKYFLEGVNQELTQDMLVFESEYIVKDDVVKLEKIFNESPNVIDEAEEIQFEDNDEV